ncbi:RNA-binding domain-containing protein [Suillus clintonianus]|uniref:RNA-binding domain-containing protein n=1 Tax=Suillus clintonianus TaxID=1904413 RepID=UPI001B85FC18|nr:RNA-binding domain-containing protein [Suillus clintonianus]KAG2147701.1 RNA-binding domain-containing protein [Suillus clintonianus]
MAPKSSLKSALKTSVSNPGKRTSFSAESTSKTKSIPKPVKEPEAAPEKSGGSDAEDDDHLYGFSTDEDDSSDEDVNPGEEVDIGKLPTVAKDDATVKRKLEKAKRHPTQDRGVIYMGCLPHGFYEDQLKGYLSQFGDVTRLRISRNKKTGRSKHYGFIEFDSASVAQIVAETMDNYLLMGHILKCKIIPKEKVHPELWVGANKKWKVIPIDQIVRKEHNKLRTQESMRKAEKRLIQRENERKRKLAEIGIAYDFDAVSYKKKPKTVAS